MNDEAGVGDGGAKVTELDASVPKKVTQKQVVKRLDAGADSGALDGSVLVDAGQLPFPKHEASFGQTVFSSIFGLMCCFGPILPIIGIWATWNSVMRSRSRNTKIIRDVTRPFRR